MEFVVVILGVLLAASLLVVMFLAKKLHKTPSVPTISSYSSNERDRILTLINNLTSAVISTDSNGAVDLYNSFSLDLIDTNKDIEGRSLGDILKLSTDDGKPVDILNELQTTTGLKQTSDWQILLGEDDSISLDTVIAPIRSGGASALSERPDGYVVILRDITKQKSIEEEKNEFISVVSHELRTPVTIAEGALSNMLLMMERPETTAKQLNDSVHSAYDQVLYLSRMVNDLSTLSRAERGLSDEQEVIDVEQLAYNLYESYSPEAAEKQLQFNLDLEPSLGEINTSKLYLRELLQNLIMNGIKYTPSGSVTLRVQKRGEAVYFEVADTGIGISKSDQRKIFKRFYRAEDYRTRETSGTGLGLYVASKLAKKLGCQIELESRLNHGSKFSFTIERTPPVAE